MSGTWGGFDTANIIANRQKDTYVHGYIDVSGVISSQNIKAVLDNPYQTSYNYDNSVNSYVTTTNPAYSGSYPYVLDGMAGQGNALVVVSNIANNASYAGNSAISFTANLLPLGSYYIPKFANISVTTQVPLGFDICFNANIANVFYGNLTYSNTVLNATTNSNIGNITLFQTQDYLKANCQYITSDAMTIPLGLSITGSTNYNIYNNCVLDNTSPTAYNGVGNTYTVLEFTSGTYTVTFSENTKIGFLVVGGGGGGGSNSGTIGGGGGGGGGIIYSTYANSAVTFNSNTKYTITVGAGGAAGAGSRGVNGNPSSITNDSATLNIVAGGGERGGIAGSDSVGGTVTTTTGAGTLSINFTTYSGGTGGGGGNGAQDGTAGGSPTSFSITDICGNDFKLAGGGGGSGGNQTAGGNRAGGRGGSGAGGGIGSGNSNNGGYESYSLFSKSGATQSNGVYVAGNTPVYFNAQTNTGSGGGGHCTNATAGSGASGIVYIYFIATGKNLPVVRNTNYITAPLGSTTITQTPVTVANIMVPPYYGGNAMSLNVPISSNIIFAPSTNYVLNNKSLNVGNTISFLTTIDNIYANVYQINNSDLTPYANIRIQPYISSNIYVSNNINSNIIFGSFYLNSSNPTSLRLTQYLYTANIIFTPAYSTLTNNYIVKMYSSGNINSPNSGVNAGLLGNIEYVSLTTSGNVNGTISGTTLTGNYTAAANVTMGGNYYTGLSFSSNIGTYSANIYYINSYNTNKPNIQLTYAPNVYVTNSANTIVYTLNTSDFANNYITTIKVPDLDILMTSLNPNYSANIIVGNINIPQNNANIFGNILNTDFYKLVASGNLKVTLNNFPTAANVSASIGNITMYANPPFNTTNGNSIFANSTTGSINTVNPVNYYKLSGNISLSKTLFYYNANIANITIMDEANTIIGNIPASQYYVNGVVGANTLLSATYLNIPSNTNTYIKDYYGNVSFNYTFPTNNVSNKTYTAYLSLNGNIGTPYTTNILDTNVYSNIYSKQIDDSFIDNNSNNKTDLKSSFTTNRPITTGNLYIYNLNSVSDITIGGDINLTGKINSPDITFSGNLTTTATSFLFNTKSDNNVKLNVNADNIDVVINTNIPMSTYGSYKLYKCTTPNTSYTFSTDKDLNVGFIIVGGGGGGGGSGGGASTTSIVKGYSGGGGGGGGVIYVPYTSNYKVNDLKIGVGNAGGPGTMTNGTSPTQPAGRLNTGKFSTSPSNITLVSGSNGGDSYIYNNLTSGNIIAGGGYYGTNNSAGTWGQGGQGGTCIIPATELSPTKYTSSSGGKGGGNGQLVVGGTTSFKVTNGLINIDTYYGGGGQSGGTGKNGGGGSTGPGANTSSTATTGTATTYAVGESGGPNTGGGGGGGTATLSSNEFYGVCGGDGGTGYVLIFTIPTSKARLTIANTSFYKDGYVDVLADSAGKGLNAIFRGDADNDRANVVLSYVGANCTLAPALTGSSFSFYGYAGTTKYKATVTNGTLFTGQHANYPLDLDLKTNNSNYVGLLVSSADQGYFSRNKVTKEVITDKKAITITESLPKLILTNKDKDPAVWGVISNVKNDDINSDGTIPTDQNNMFSNGLAFDMIRVNGLGEGAMWVTNINGNISNGDYICSSIIPGYGRKQDDDILYNYTTAKATMSCNFDINNNNLYECEELEYEGNTYLKAFIGVSYHCS